MRGYVKRVDEGKYRLVYDKPRSLNGKRKQKTETIYGNKKKAEAVLAQRIAEIRDGSYADSGTLTLQDLIDRFLSSQATLSPTTLERYAGIAKNQIAPTLGHVPLKQLTPLHLQEAYSAWLRNGRVDKPGGLKPQTVLHCHRFLPSGVGASGEVEDGSSQCRGCGRSASL